MAVKGSVRSVVPQYDLQCSSPVAAWKEFEGTEGEGDGR